MSELDRRFLKLGHVKIRAISRTDSDVSHITQSELQILARGFRFSQALFGSELGASDFHRCFRFGSELGLQIFTDASVLALGASDFHTEAPDLVS